MQHQQQRYRAICHYNDGKFELRVGDLVTCEQTNHSWWGGTNLRTGLKGWYPATYVEPVAALHSMPPPPSRPPPSYPNQAHSQQIPTVNAVPVPQPNWSAQQLRHESPPAWATEAPMAQGQQPAPLPRERTSDVFSSVGKWFKEGLANSSVGGSGQPAQTVTTVQKETNTQHSGHWLLGTATTKQTETTRTTMQQASPAGRMAKRVGDTAVMSAVWGATTLRPKQMLAAAALATGAYAVEGNQRSKTQK